MDHTAKKVAMQLKKMENDDRPGDSGFDMEDEDVTPVCKLALNFVNWLCNVFFSQHDFRGGGSVNRGNPHHLKLYQAAKPMG